MAFVRQIARDAALAVLEERTATRKPKSFSSVGNTEASVFLGDLKMVQVDGNAAFEEELQLPDDIPTCVGFDISDYQDENAATRPLLQHHQMQLERLGVRFGRAGFSTYDIHTLTNESLLIQHGNKAFRGIFDSCIAPYGLSLGSALRQCRIVYEHKMPGVSCNVFYLVMQTLSSMSVSTSLEVLSCKCVGRWVAQRVVKNHSELSTYAAGAACRRSAHIRARQFLSCWPRAPMGRALCCWT